MLTKKDPNGLKLIDQQYRACQEEKWHFASRVRQLKKLLPGMAKKLRWGHRQFPPKCMYSAVSGIPFFEHGFDGKVCFVRMAKWKVAKRQSYKWENGEKVISHRKGERYPVDCEMNAKRFKRHL